MKKRPKSFSAEGAEEARRDRREEKAPEFNTEGTEVAQRALRRALGCAPTIARFSGFAAVISLLQRRARVVRGAVASGVYSRCSRGIVLEPWALYRVGHARAASGV